MKILSTSFLIIGIILSLDSSLEFLNIDYSHPLLSDLIAGLMAGLIVAFFLSSPLSPMTKPMIQTGNHFTQDNTASISIQNLGDQKGQVMVELSSFGVDYFGVKNRFIMPRQSKKVSFFDLKGSTNTYSPYYKTEFEILDKEKVKETCSNLTIGEKSNLRDDSINITYIVNKTTVMLPTSYQFAVYPKDGQGIRRFEQFEFPKEDRVLDFGLDYRDVSPKAEKTETGCNIGANFYHDMYLSYFGQNETYNEHYWYFDEERYPRPVWQSDNN